MRRDDPHPAAATWMLHPADSRSSIRSAPFHPHLSLLLLLLLTCCINLSPLFVIAQAADFELQLVFTAGVRGRMMPINGGTLSDCTLDDVEWDASHDCTSCLGGVSRRAALIESYLSSSPNQTLILDVGNFLFGSLYTKLDHGRLMANMFGRSHYQVSGIGPNDLFAGPALYGDFVRALPSSIQVVCSNVDVDPVATNPIPANLIRSYAVVDMKFNGTVRPIGVVGCIDPALNTIASAGTAMAVNDAFTCVSRISRAISDMKKERPDVNIIVAYACTTQPNRHVAYDIAANADGVDAVVTEFNPSDVTTRISLVQSVFGYRVPIFSVPIPASSANPTLILGATVINAKLNFDSAGVWEYAYDHPADPFVDPSTSPQLRCNYPDDPTLWNTSTTTPQGLVQQAVARIAAMGSEVVGQIGTDLTGVVIGKKSDEPGLCFNAVCNIGLFIAESMLHWCSDCDLAHINAGGLLSNILLSDLASPPNVTRGDLAKTLQFDNTLVSYNIQGRYLLDRVIIPSIKLLGVLGFQQYSGLRVGFNPDTKNVVMVQVRNRAGEWAPINRDATYKVVTIFYLYNGGDGYDLQDVAQKVDLFGPKDLEAAIDFMEEDAQAVMDIPSADTLKACYETKYEMESLGPWTAPSYCTIATTPSIGNLANICPTSNSTVDDGQPFCRPGAEAYPGKYFNSSINGCDRCSGLGACEYGLRRCVCDAPTTDGPFAGMVMVQGPACDQIRQEYEYGSILYYAHLGTSGFSLLLALCVSLFFFVNRSARVIRRSSIAFLQVCCFGAALGSFCAAIIAYPTSDQSCQLADWIGNSAFILLFGSLFLKTWRIQQIFSAGLRQKSYLTDKYMFLRLLALLLAEAAIHVTELFISPQYAQPVEYGSGSNSCGASSSSVVASSSSSSLVPMQDPFLFFYRCRSTHWAAFEWVTWVSKILLTVWGAVLAISVRNIEAKEFNEAKFLGLCIYNMAICAGMAKAALILIDRSAPDVSMSIQVFTINYICMSTMLGLAVPKYLAMRAGDYDGSSSGHIHSGGRLGSWGSGGGKGAASNNNGTFIGGGPGSPTSKSKKHLTNGSSASSPAPFPKTAVGGKQGSMIQLTNASSSSATSSSSSNSPNNSGTGESSPPLTGPPGAFQTICTRQIDRLRALSVGDRRNQVEKFLRVTQEFLKNLEELNEQMGGGKMRGDVNVHVPPSPLTLPQTSSPSKQTTQSPPASPTQSSAHASSPSSPSIKSDVHTSAGGVPTRAPTRPGLSRTGTLPVRSQFRMRPIPISQTSSSASNGLRPGSSAVTSPNTESSSASSSSVSPPGFTDIGPPSANANANANVNRSGPSSLPLYGFAGETGAIDETQVSFSLQDDRTTRSPLAAATSSMASSSTTNSRRIKQRRIPRGD